MQRKTHLLLSIFIVIALAACKSAPIYNIDDTQFSNAHSKSLQKVSAAIVTACKKARWKAQLIQPGKIQATYSHKKKRFSAAVMIEYDRDSYAIHYLRSQNLKYKKKLADDKQAYEENNFKQIFSNDNGADRIHKVYNSWVKSLEKSINYEISLLNTPQAVPTTKPEDQPGSIYSACATHKPSIKISGLAYIQGSKVNLRGGSSTRCPIVGTLTKGAEVSLLGKNGKWLYIQLQDRSNAWIHSSLITLVTVPRPSPAQHETETETETNSTPPPPTPPSKRISIAVIQFKTLNKEKQDISLGDLISENFTTALVNSNNFKIIEREQLDKVVKEMEMTQTGFIEATDAVEIGKMLHADAIITGSVTLLNKHIQLHARIIEIESAFVISAESATTRYSLDEIKRAINNIVHKLSSKLLTQRKK